MVRPAVVRPAVRVRGCGHSTMQCKADQPAVQLSLSNGRWTTGAKVGVAKAGYRPGESCLIRRKTGTALVAAMVHMESGGSWARK
jgi:hypothetical protein